MSSIRPYASGVANYRNERFHNSEPSSTFTPTGNQTSILSSVLTRGRIGRPSAAIPLATPLAPADAGELAVTWYGHASALIEIDGRRVLADPVWSERVSPSSLVGPARLHPNPVAIEALPQVDAIVVSHDHYDHLDQATVAALSEHQTAPFIVPIGLGAHLRGWGVDESRIVELDWGKSTSVADLTITCTEARHFSGRGLVRNTTLWSSWSIVGPSRSAYFGGDTGYTSRFADIGAELGPYDLTLLPVGAYDEHWPDIHMNPEEAVRAHADLCRGDATHGLFIPIHWATFNLAFHSWAEPVERATAAAAAVGTAVFVPMPGQRVDALRPAGQEEWWANLS
ncbi:hypothetical protein FOY51_19905 [Antrihabitans cavernicola]|uniref:Metallo-beta-lactamase domain-containing protein n=2 Tax=Antrihabitans cavernicola TaxID=2495913 RepID=A0A5A7S9Q2_9NOCA|nr:hypothetical protein FOY51_19905 [Spelaeibacter cavernicola]